MTITGTVHSFNALGTRRTYDHVANRPSSRSARCGRTVVEATGRYASTSTLNLSDTRLTAAQVRTIVRALTCPACRTATKEG